MIKRAVAAGHPTGVVLADCAYGNASCFRAGLRELSLDYGVAVQGSTMVWRLDAKDARRGPFSLWFSMLFGSLRNQSAWILVFVGAPIFWHHSRDRREDATTWQDPPRCLGGRCRLPLP